MNVDEETGNCILQLPRDAKTHNVFAPDKLKKYNNPITIQPSTKEEREQLGDISLEEATEYEVETILGLQTIDGTDHWLVKWRGCGNDSNT